MSQYLLDVRGVVKRFGGLIALQDLSLQIEAGTIVGLIGPNGAGKTTLLRTLSGLKEASAGSATWNDSPILGRRAEDLARSGIMHVSDGKSVIAELSVKDNLALTGLWRKDKKDVKTATNEVVEL